MSHVLLEAGGAHANTIQDRSFVMATAAPAIR
jgi:hypothetical protein